MNSNTKIDKLAETLLLLYEDKKTIVDLQKKLLDLQYIFAKEPAFLEFYSDPSMSEADKKDFTNQWIKKFGFDLYFNNTILLLIDYKLTTSIGYFVDILLESINTVLQIKNVYITSTVPFNDAQRKKFQAVFQKRFSRCKLVYHYDVDPSLILGIRVKYDDVLEEVSLTSQLAKITKELSKHLIR